MGRSPEDPEQINPEGDWPPEALRYRVDVTFDGGPCDGTGTMELCAPPGLSITTLEFTEHPEGYYQKVEGEHRYRWRLH
jgi:hypothetical protein